MILPIRFLWKQLNGSQITAICKAIYGWLKDMFEDIFTYWNNFSIDTAKDSHLTLIGLMSGFIRPYITIAAEGYQYFTDGPYSMQSYGVSDLNGDTTYGGKFTDLSEQLYKDRYYLQTEYYRKVLKACLSVGGELNSLIALDYTLAAIWECYRNDGYGYAFDFVQQPYNNRTYGDIEIQLGSATAWGDNLNKAVGVIYNLRDTVYYPQPRLIIRTSEDGSPLDTENGEHLEIQENNLVTGLLQVEIKTEVQ